MANTMSAAENCKNAMNKGIVKFAYQKADGSIRVAIGTRCLALIESMGKSSQKSTERMRAANPEVCNYFDLVKNDWRCFRMERFSEAYYDANLSPKFAAANAVGIALEARDHEAVESSLECAKSLLNEDDAMKLVESTLVYIQLRPNFKCDWFSDAIMRGIFANTDKYVQAIEEPTQTEEPKPIEDDKEMLFKRLCDLRREEEEVLARLLSIK